MKVEAEPMSGKTQNAEKEVKNDLLELVNRALTIGAEDYGDYCLLCGEPAVIRQFPGLRFCQTHAAWCGAVYAVALGRWAKDYTGRETVQSFLQRNFSWRLGDPAQHLPGVNSWTTGYTQFQDEVVGEYLDEIAAVAQVLLSGGQSLIRQAFEIIARIEERPAITERLDQMTAFLDRLHYQIGDSGAPLPLPEQPPAMNDADHSEPETEQPVAQANREGDGDQSQQQPTETATNDDDDGTVAPPPEPQPTATEAKPKSKKTPAASTGEKEKK